MKKKYRKLIWLIFPLMIIMFVGIQWDTWFTNPPEPAYTPSPDPAQILLTWSANSDNSRDVTWQGDTITRSGSLELVESSTPGDTVRYQSTPRIIKTMGGASAFFKVGMNNLKPSDSYRYRVANGNRWSEWYSFRMGGQPDSLFSFLFFGDVQDSVNGKIGEIFHKAAESLPNAAFMVFIGDIIERPHNAYWAEWFRAGGKLLKTIPVIATPGNHEFYKGLIQKLDDRWSAHFSIPQNGPPNFRESSCYWDYQNTRFISLDSNGIQTISTALEQRRWLKSVLENTRQRWIIVMIHHSLYSTTRGRNYFYLRTLFKPLFDQFKVDLVLSGHDHVYGRAAHIPNDFDKDKQGPVYVVSHTSPKFYDIGFSRNMDKMATNTAMYQLFDVSRDSVRFRAYTFEGTFFDGFTIKKDAAGNRALTVNSPPNTGEYLKPSERFIRKSSKNEIDGYYHDMEEWKKTKQ
jgi:3',5'-cyclic AMP phosphodiesterase CpdA